MVAEKADLPVPSEICKTEEDLDLDDLIINEMPKTEGPELINSTTDQSQKLNDLASPRRKLVTFD
ncbi:unnamed protein product (macronuclear) [Paramecium tetraurelia]|uniref:Uncharacterized protein n=1 Tax=Paramecium tetraurelia TaxID=5888 RepID=A0E9R5_PARTE|nr:uncharacterized protein GSPATT00024763001 [Paramecium tetraurelia]CAK92032.1 unnamed protein product [Paramecium tetraurelia]|eukprot:XP_001459429.1 hypothetical protein (macronuclear) [Paramecium tetraurelia strain d4-2]